MIHFHFNMQTEKEIILKIIFNKHAIIKSQNTRNIKHLKQNVAVQIYADGIKKRFNFHCLKFLPFRFDCSAFNFIENDTSS